MNQSNLIKGARNLLLNCAGLNKGEKVLILHEDPSLGWYDFQAPQAVFETAVNLGIEATLQQVSGPTNEPNQDLAQAWKTHNNIISFARIGDQDRFAQGEANKKLTMCYVLNQGMLSSAFGTADHRAFKEIKQAINTLLLGADQIEITCPLGTSLQGAPRNQRSKPEHDVSVLRFPMAVPIPVKAADFSGKVALCGYLTPTGSKMYSPIDVKIDGRVFAEIEQGRIKTFSGDDATVEKIKAHYQKVAQQFNLDADIVDSWHAGIHPGCPYTSDMDANPDLWSNSVFGNPRCLHFHTCGNYAPGEISWMVLEPTIQIDGKNLWDHGKLKLDDFELTQTCLKNWPSVAPLFIQPSDTIGL